MVSSPKTTGIHPKIPLDSLSSLIENKDKGNSHRMRRPLVIAQLQTYRSSLAFTPAQLNLHPAYSSKSCILLGSCVYRRT